MQLLAMHERIAHGSNASAIVNVKPEKFPRPNVGLDQPGKTLPRHGNSIRKSMVSRERN